MDKNNKYGIPEPYSYQINIFDEAMSEGAVDEEVWRVFLIVTDHIPNKIIERLIEDLASATLTDFILVFINFIKAVRVEYSEILQLRKTAREEINRLEGTN